MLSAILFELIAFLIALVGVLLTARGHIAGWLFGILGSAMYIPVFFETRLYAESSLQSFYVLMGIYGWWQWLRMGKKSEERPVQQIGKTAIIVLSLLLLVGTGVLGFCLDEYSNTDVPYFDACMGVAGLLITWMMARKYIENWYCWMLVDIVNSGLFIYKHLVLTAFLYIAMALLALYGAKRWKKELHSA